MAKYTTGEIAKLVGVSVRTVQYYDARGILVPSEFSDGGRRLYSEDDLKRMRIICFLREAGFPINSISELLAEKDTDKIITTLLDEQERVLREEMAERQSRLDVISGIKREIKEIENFSLDSIGDIAHIVQSKKSLSKMRLGMVLVSLPITILQWSALILGITRGFWWMFAVWAAAAIPVGIAISAYYIRRTAYICPECHEVFVPKLKEIIFARHTPRMRRVTCSSCGHRGFSVEVYRKKEK